MLLFTPSEPLAGWEMMRRVAVAGVMVTGRFNGVALSVVPETMDTVGAVEELPESLLGPWWQV